MAKTITKMNKEELLYYLKENPNKYKSLYTKKYISKINWDYIPEEIITENKSILETLNWDYISIIPGASECFIAKHKGLVDWNYISVYQKLSESFIIEHNGLVKWKLISKYQKLSESFIKKYKDYLDMYLVNDNWLNKSTKFKKSAVVNTGKYECYEDYFIAYKGIRSDRYSCNDICCRQ